MFDFIKSWSDSLELVLGMADRFDIAFEVADLCSQNAVDGCGVSEVVGFQHIDQEMHRGARYVSDRVQESVERKSISLKDSLSIVPVVVLQVIDLVVD